ncbi:MAG: hypothetical protein DME43_02550 [Verrucomicrobia bacterium]|nr:MAG: hypothetical protein DME43_02550 [Verrucomicrobiota bacterium]
MALVDSLRVDRWLYSSWSSTGPLFRSRASGANEEHTRLTHCLRIQSRRLCCRVFARLARFSRHRRRIISAVASGLVGVTVGHRLLDRASRHSGRHWYHHDPLSLGHALGGRGLVAERSAANSPKDRSPRGFFRVADEPPLLLVGANAGQFRRCGLARGIVARRDVNRNAGTLATGISVAHWRGYSDHRNRNWFWRRSFVDRSLAAAVATLLGLFLGLILIVHRSIWPAVIAHGFFDATTFALLPLVASKLPQLHS